MKPAWHAWIERWLGVDATFLATAAAHLGLSWLMPALVQLSWVGKLSVEEDAWMACIGWMAASNSLLGIWTALGPGRMAVRCVWALALSLTSWFVQTQWIWQSDLLAVVTAAVALFAGVVSLASGLTLKLLRGTRLKRAGSAGLDVPERWQFRLADLLLFTLAAAIVVAARVWLEDYGPLFYEFGSDPGGHILYTIRCGGAMCACIVLASTLLLVRDRPRILWTIAACVSAMGSAVLLTWLPLEGPSFGEVTDNLRVYGMAAAGCLVATCGTLLPLRVWGWRCTSGRASLPLTT
jgi:hypothetical protein